METELAIVCSPGERQVSIEPERGQEHFAITRELTYCCEVADDLEKSGC